MARRKEWKCLRPTCATVLDLESGRLLTPRPVLMDWNWWSPEDIVLFSLPSEVTATIRDLDVHLLTAGSTEIRVMVSGIESTAPGQRDCRV